MSSTLHHPVLCVSLAALPLLDLAGLMQACSEHIHNGARVLTLFGRLQTLATKDVVLTAVFQSPSLGLVALQGHAQADDSYDSLTLRHPAMHIFERELWEQTGITPVGHPWLKPVRYERDRQQQMSSYPFFKVRGAFVLDHPEGQSLQPTIGIVPRLPVGHDEDDAQAFRRHVVFQQQGQLVVEVRAHRLRGSGRRRADAEDERHRERMAAECRSEAADRARAHGSHAMRVSRDSAPLRTRTR